MIEHTTQWVLDNSPDPADPAEINWPERQARALIPFEVYRGRPMCPCRQMGVHTVYRGRNDMRFWGENPMADALVTAIPRGVPHVLLIDRWDGRGWAMPGGAIEPGEDAFTAAMRELHEETGMAIPYHWEWKGMDAPRWVPDPRGSMEAWAVTMVARCDLGEVESLPEVRGGDDARWAEWFPIEVVQKSIESIFPAHREILEALR